MDFVGYAQTPRELKGTRNRVTGGRRKGKEGAGAVDAPRFRSEKGRKGEEREGKPGEDEDEVERDGKSKYRKVEIQYSRFGQSFFPSPLHFFGTSVVELVIFGGALGVEDFDFG